MLKKLIFFQVYHKLLGNLHLKIKDIFVRDSRNSEYLEMMSG